MTEVIDSILNSIKKMLGLSDTDTAFDVDIIIDINSALFAVNQLGVGPTTPFVITDATATWDSFSTDVALYSAVKSYVYLKVKQIFDPPTTASVLESYANQIRELEWRLTVQVDLNTPVTPTP